MSQVVNSSIHRERDESGGKQFHTYIEKDESGGKQYHMSQVVNSCQ